jgi:hypothetical protein
MARTLTEDEQKLVRQDRARQLAKTSNNNTGNRAVQADSAKTVLGFIRTLKGVSVEALSKQTKILADDLRRAENGGTVMILQREAAALKKALGRSADDLLRPLTYDTKLAALHHLPMPAKGK